MFPNSLTFQTHRAPLLVPYNGYYSGRHPLLPSAARRLQFSNPTATRVLRRRWRRGCGGGTETPPAQPENEEEWVFPRVRAIFSLKRKYMSYRQDFSFSFQIHPLVGLGFVMLAVKNKNAFLRLITGGFWGLMTLLGFWAIVSFLWVKVNK